MYITLNSNLFFSLFDVKKNREMLFLKYKSWLSVEGGFGKVWRINDGMIMSETKMEGGVLLNFLLDKSATALLYLSLDCEINKIIIGVSSDIHFQTNFLKNNNVSHLERI